MPVYIIHSEKKTGSVVFLNNIFLTGGLSFRLTNFRVHKNPLIKKLCKKPAKIIFTNLHQNFTNLANAENVR